MNIVAFSGSKTARQCVDCPSSANRLVSYTLYNVGDLCCQTHAEWRRQVLNRVRCFVGPIPPRDQLRLI